MILTHIRNNVSIEMLNDNLNYLVIEDKHEYDAWIVDVYKHLSKQAETFMLSENNKKIDFVKNVIMITSPLDIALDGKLSQKTLYSEIERTLAEYGVENELLTMTQVLLDKLDDLGMYFDYEIDYSDAISLADVLKMANVSIRKPEGTFTERFIEFASVITQVSGARFFILANCKSVIEDEEIKHIEKWAQYKCVYVLLVENSDFDDNSDSNKYIIDKDLCLIH